MKIEVAHHTGLTVSSVDRALGFWHEALGFPIVHQTILTPPFSSGITGVPEAEIKVAIVALPGGHLLEFLEYQKPRGVVYKPQANDVGSSHLALRLEKNSDLEEAVELAKKHGYRLVGELAPVTVKPFIGARACYVKDEVDGVLIEFMTPAPPQ